MKQNKECTVETARCYRMASGVYVAGRGNGKSRMSYRILLKTLKYYNILKLIALISSIIAVISSIKCLMYNCIINELINENNAKNIKIESLENELLHYKEVNNESVN